MSTGRLTTRQVKGKHDKEINDCLANDLGLTVLRFRYDQRENGPLFARIMTMFLVR